jgi:hypothetical protein
MVGKVGAGIPQVIIISGFRLFLEPISCRLFAGKA